MQRRAFFQALCAMIGATLVEPSRALATEPKAAGVTDDGAAWQLIDGEAAIHVSWHRLIEPRSIMLGVVVRLEPGVVYTIRIEPPDGDDKPSWLRGIRSFNPLGEIEILSHEDAHGPVAHHATDMGFFNTDDVYVECGAVIRKGHPVTMRLRAIDDLPATLNMVVIVDVHPQFVEFFATSGCSCPMDFGPFPHSLPEVTS